MIRSEQGEPVEVMGVRIVPTVERTTIVGRDGAWFAKLPVRIDIEIDGKSISIPLRPETEADAAENDHDANQ
jgi:hypothetical protein